MWCLVSLTVHRLWFSVLCSDWLFCITHFVILYLPVWKLLQPSYKFCCYVYSRYPMYYHVISNESLQTAALNSYYPAKGISYILVVIYIRPYVCQTCCNLFRWSLRLWMHCVLRASILHFSLYSKDMYDLYSVNISDIPWNLYKIASGTWRRAPCV